MPSLWTIIFAVVFYAMSILPASAEVGKPLFRFGVFADAQYADTPSAGSRYYRASLGKLDECVAEFNRSNLAFVIQLGDLIDNDTANYAAILDHYNKTNAPRYHVVGNHDCAYKKETPDRAVNSLGMKNRYYDFIVSDWRFIVLDANDISLYDPVNSDAAKAMLDALRKENRPNARTYNGAIGMEQLKWLKAKLDASTKEGQKVVIFCHMPIQPFGGDCNLWNDEELAKTLESYTCIQAWINGHNHYGNYIQRNGIHYITLQGMVETPETNAYAIIDVFPDKLAVNGFGRIPSKEYLTHNPATPTQPRP